MVNIPLPGGADGEQFHQTVNDIWLPRLRAFKPEMIFISAGFDARYEDDLGGLKRLPWKRTTRGLQSSQQFAPTKNSWRKSFQCSKEAMFCRRWRKTWLHISRF